MLVDVAACVLLYVGTHDECDRWLKRNTGFEVPQDVGRFKAISSMDEDWELAESPEIWPAVEDDGDELLMPEIDDRTLRRIFCGLSGEKIWSIPVGTAKGVLHPTGQCEKCWRTGGAK